MSTLSSVSRRLIRQKKFRKLLGACLIISVVLGLLIVKIEQVAPDTQFHSSFDGIYWAITTITTVGYGDIVPVTIGGKLIAILLQVVGTLMFALVIALISMYFDKTQVEFYWSRLFERMSQLEEKVDSLKRSSDFIVKKEKDDD